MRIDIRGVSKVYPNGFRALDGVATSIERGLHGLLGPNGAGKTTLMRILATLLEPTSGTIEIDGEDLAADRGRLRRKLGYLGQEWDAPRAARCWEIVDLTLRLRGVTDGRRRRGEVQRLLALVGLQASASAKVKTLSGGMVRRLGVAQALAGDPELIVMDEPTVGLDPDERVEFRNLLSHLGRERTILLSTHIVADVGSTCSRVTVLSKGRVEFDGAPADLAAKARGKVFESLVPEAGQAEILASVAGVVSSTPTPSGSRMRTIGRPPERFHPVEVEPSLEDAYLTLVPAASGESAWTA
jgi:ABC-2 type transport system ATP-binding protein